MDIHTEIEYLLNNVKIPLEDNKMVNEYLEHDEWGIALEHLSATLLEESVEITEFIYSKLKQVGEFMELKSQTWESLEHLVRT